MSAMMIKINFYIETVHLDKTDVSRTSRERVHVSEHGWRSTYPVVPVVGDHMLLSAGSVSKPRSIYGVIVERHISYEPDHRGDIGQVVDLHLRPL